LWISGFQGVPRPEIKLVEGKSQTGMMGVKEDQGW
jgi:hypothetical protein